MEKERSDTKIGITLMTTGYLLSCSRYFNVSDIVILSIWTIASLAYVYSGRALPGS